MGFSSLYVRAQNAGARAARYEMRSAARDSSGRMTASRAIARNRNYFQGRLSGDREAITWPLVQP
jgi:hypothetical protein